MTDSAFWRELAATFLLVPGHEMIRVDLQYAIGSGEAWQWRLAGNPNEFMETTFKRLATRGAFEIAPVGTTDLVGAWLEAIRKEGINFHQREGPKGYVFAHIDRVFEASAILCGKLEARAVQAAFDEKHRNDSKNYSTLRQATPTPARDATSSTLPVAQESVRFRPLDDYYQVVEFDGRQYELTPTQSTVIRVLHKAHLEKRGSVGIKEIQKALQINSGKMSGWFRDKKNKHLYGKLIVQTGSRNHYRLDL